MRLHRVPISGPVQGSCNGAKKAVAQAASRCVTLRLRADAGRVSASALLGFRELGGVGRNLRDTFPVDIP